MKRRQDFLACARGRTEATPGLVLQGRDRGDGLPPRIGFTATKKLGNAVVRNRVKRRLRAVTQIAISAEPRAGFDYVLIGRDATAERAFGALQQDLTVAMARLHAALSRQS